MSILFRREELAPALQKDRPLHDLALVWRGELQANLTALRAFGKPLVVGVRLLDLVCFFDFLIAGCWRNFAAGGQKTNGQTSALEQRTAR